MAEGVLSEGSYKYLAKGAAYNFVLTILVVLFQLITTILLVRLLPVEQYGIYLLLFAALSFIGIASSFALWPIQRFVPAFMEKGNYAAAKRLVMSCFYYIVLVGTIFLVLFEFFPGALSFLFKGGNLLPIYTALFGFVVFFQLLQGPLDWVLNALWEQKFRNISRLIHTIMVFGLTYALLVLGFGLPGVLWALLVATIALFLMFYFLVYKKFLKKSSVGEKNIEWRRIIRFAAFSQISYFGQIFLVMSVELFLIGAMLGVDAVALYGFATKVTLTPFFHSPAVLTAPVILPFIVQKYLKSQRKQEMSYYFEMYCRFTAFFSFPMLVGLVILAVPVISFIFNPSYLPALPIFVASSALYALLSFEYPLKNIFDTLEKPEIGAIAKIFLPIGIVLNFFLISAGFGINEVILVSGSMLALMFFTEFFLTRRHLRLMFPLKEFARIALNVAIMGIVVLLLAQFAQGIVSLIAVVLAGAAAYFAASYYNKPFTLQDMVLFSKMGKIGAIAGRFCAKK